MGKDIPIKKIYSKYVLRMLISFIVWSVVYAIFANGSILNKLSMAVQGHYHMWFILMIIGLYMCVPIIRPIVNNNSIVRYFLLLAFLFSFFIPSIMTLIKDFGSENIIKVANAFYSDVSSMQIRVVMGYVGYFVLGYYLEQISFTKKQRIVVYLLGLFGFAFTIGMSSIVSLKLQSECDHYYGYFMLNVLFEAIAVFTFFKYIKYNNDKLNNVIKHLSKYSFGVYLMHALILEQLYRRVGLTTLSFNPILSVVCISFIVFLVACVLSALLNHIPIVKKYIV